MFRDLLREWAEEKETEIRYERLKVLDAKIAECLTLSETEEWWLLDDMFSKPYATKTAHAQHWIPMLFDGRLPIERMPQTLAILNRWKADESSR